MMEWYQHILMPCFLQASDSSFMMSRLKGVFATLQSVYFDGNRLKPSWCLVVMVMYFIPAAFAIRTHLSASNFTGLNWPWNFSYSSTGI